MGRFRRKKIQFFSKRKYVYNVQCVEMKQPVINQSLPKNKNCKHNEMVVCVCVRAHAPMFSYSKTLFFIRSWLARVPSIKHPNFQPIWWDAISAAGDFLKMKFHTLFSTNLLLVLKTCTPWALISVWFP